MSNFWNWFLLIYGTVGFTWSIWALYMQHKLHGKKNLIKSWAFNFVGWPVSLVILAKHKLKDSKFSNWYWKYEFITLPATVVLVVILIVGTGLSLATCEEEPSNVVDTNDNPVIETVQLGKVVEGWYLQTDNMDGRTKIQTEHLTVIVSGLRNVTKGNNAYINNHKNGSDFLCIDGEKYCWSIY